MTKNSKGPSAETWTYGYDNRDQLVWAEKRASDGGTLEMRADYKYDVFGNRIEKQVDTDGDGVVDTTQKFAYDGWRGGMSPAVSQVFADNSNWDIWADLDGSGSLTTRYVRGDAVDQLFARIESGGATYWTLTDRLGSVREVIDNSGTVKDAITYDGFGNIINESGSTFRGRYTFTGREWDAEIQMQYNRARWYDPATGRWISQDPLGFDAGDGNLYRYTMNQPTVATDPSGLDYLTGQGAGKQYGLVRLVDSTGWFYGARVFYTDQFHAGNRVGPLVYHKGKYYLFSDLKRAAENNIINSESDFNEWVKQAQQRYQNIKTIAAVSAKLAQAAPRSQIARTVLRAVLKKYAGKSGGALTNSDKQFAVNWPQALVVAEWWHNKLGPVTEKLDFGKRLDKFFAAKRVTDICVEGTNIIRLFGKREHEPTDALRLTRSVLSIGGTLKNAPLLGESMPNGFSDFCGVYVAYIDKAIELIGNIKDIGKQRNIDAILKGRFTDLLGGHSNLPFGYEWARKQLGEYGK